VTDPWSSKLDFSCYAKVALKSTQNDFIKHVIETGLFRAVRQHFKQRERVERYAKNHKQTEWRFGPFYSTLLAVNECSWL